MVQALFPTLSLLGKPLLTNRWETKEIIAKVEQPILFIRTKNDEIVPDSQMDVLVGHAANKEAMKQLVLEVGGHNDNWFQNP